MSVVIMAVFVAAISMAEGSEPNLVYPLCDDCVCIDGVVNS